MDYVLGIAVMAVLIGLGFWYVSWSNKKRKAEVWTGKVVKKWIATFSDEDGDVTKTPTIQVALDGGKKKKLTIGADLYNGLVEGDTVEKRAGEMDPVKVG